MGSVRRATVDDIDLVTRIGAGGFYDDPVMIWVFPDPSTRLERLVFLFLGLANDMIPEGGVVHVTEDASAAFWRDPSFNHERTAADRIANTTDAVDQRTPFAEDELARLRVLGDTMMAVHPHGPHWYLNVISTLTGRQGQGLGARVLAPVLAECDASGSPAYLESTNPRNMTLYRRHGFVETAELELPDGPSLHSMWRAPA
jgi:GNAT superfamily N-acetyltransferase